MDTRELEQILNGLDRRLALGEIDLGTYNSLKAKFTVQAQTAGSEDPLSKTVDAIPKSAAALKCPGCMAPLPPPQDPSQTVVICDFCGGTFALQVAADEMERLRADIRKWVSEVAGGSGGGSTIDSASRQFIFKDKIYPSLSLAANRATEMFSMTRYGALFSFPAMGRLRTSPFLAALQTMPDSSFSYLVDKIKVTTARVTAPEVEVFAVGDRERSALANLELQCQETIYLSNVRRHINSYSVEGYDKAVTNLQALNGFYEKVGRYAGNENSSLATFCSGLGMRMSAIKGAVLGLKELSAQKEGAMSASLVSSLENSAAECEAAALKMEASGREPKELVPAAEGARNDALAIRALADCVRLFGGSGADEGIAFSEFQGALAEVIDHATDSSSDVQWLEQFVEGLSLHMDAVYSGKSVMVLHDFHWLDERTASQAKSSMFAGKETPNIDQKVLMPFFVAGLEFSKEKGLIFRKGQAAQALLLQDISRLNSATFVVPPENPVSAQVYRAIEAEASMGTSTKSVVPVLSRDRALATMKRFINSTPGYAGGYPKPIGIVYLPAAAVRYVNKKGERAEFLFCVDGVSLGNPKSQRLKLGSRWIEMFS